MVVTSDCMTIEHGHIIVGLNPLILLPSTSIDINKWLMVAPMKYQQPQWRILMLISNIIKYVGHFLSCQPQFGIIL